MIDLRTRKYNRLPKTGQVTSYNSGDDGEHESGLQYPVARFEQKTVDGVPISIDHHTNLMWPVNPDGIFGVTETWADALAHVDYVNSNGGYAGFTDWRMPNVQEVLSIYDYGADWHYNLGGWYANIWTSTTYYSESTKAWQFSFMYTSLYITSKTNSTDYRGFMVRSL